MDLQKPINIHELFSIKNQVKCDSAQINQLSFLMIGIKEICRLSNCLTEELRRYPNSESYDYYIKKMIKIFNELLKSEDLLRNAFPGFYYGRQVQLIRAHMKFLER